MVAGVNIHTPYLTRCAFPNNVRTKPQGATNDNRSSGHPHETLQRAMDNCLSPFVSAPSSPRPHQPERTLERRSGRYRPHPIVRITRTASSFSNLASIRRLARADIRVNLSQTAAHEIPDSGRGWVGTKSGDG